MSDSSILVSRDGFVATVVLNRPEKLNALTRPMWRALGAAITELSEDDSVRCIVLRGAGERAFSPGNDIGEIASERSNKAQAIEYGAIMHATAKALGSCRHPIVAQIHGLCVGGNSPGVACNADITGTVCTGDGGACDYSVFWDPDGTEGRENHYGVVYGPNGTGDCIRDTDELDGIGRFPHAHNPGATTSAHTAPTAHRGLIQPAGRGNRKDFIPEIRSTFVKKDP